MMVSRRREAGHLPVARHVDLLPTFVFPIIDVLKWGTIPWQDYLRAFAADVHVVGIIAVLLKSEVPFSVERANELLVCGNDADRGCDDRANQHCENKQNDPARSRTH